MPKAALLEDDAQFIGHLYRKAKNSAESCLQFARECGQALSKKKESVSHGLWLAWIKANEDALGFGPRTAQRLMDVGNTSSTSFSLRDTERALRDMWGNSEPAERKPMAIDAPDTRESPGLPEPHTSEALSLRMTEKEILTAFERHGYDVSGIPLRLVNVELEQKAGCVRFDYVSH